MGSSEALGKSRSARTDHSEEEAGGSARKRATMAAPAEEGPARRLPFCASCAAAARSPIARLHTASWEYAREANSRKGPVSDARAKVSRRCQADLRRPLTQDHSALRKLASRAYSQLAV